MPSAAVVQVAAAVPSAASSANVAPESGAGGNDASTTLSTSVGFGSGGGGGGGRPIASCDSTCTPASCTTTRDGCVVSPTRTISSAGTSWPGSALVLKSFQYR